MDNRKEIEDSFKAALRILETTLSGKEVPFRIVNTFLDHNGNYAKIDINGKRFLVVPDADGVKLWIADFPIKNTEGTPYPPGFIGFPSEVAGIIDRFYRELPKGPFQTLDGVGTINLNEIVREEVNKVFEQGFNYAADEVEHQNRQELEMMEAEISSALSFIQDLQTSANRLIDQHSLSGTNPVVDEHIGEAIAHINQAIEGYFDNLTPEIKGEVANRIGEIKIGK